MDILNKHFLRGLISTGVLESGRGEEAKKVAKNSLQNATALLAAVGTIDSLKDNKFLSAAGKATAGYLGVKLEEKIMNNKEQNMNENKSANNMTNNDNATFFNRQFFVGALVGGAATYILMNPKVRSKIMRTVTELWESVTTEIEGLKEEVADIQAEVHAENFNSEHEEKETQKSTDLRRKKSIKRK